MEIKFEYPLGCAKGVSYADVPESAAETGEAWTAYDTFVGSEADLDVEIRGEGMEIKEIIFTDPLGDGEEIIRSGIRVLAPAIKRLSELELGDVDGLYMNSDEEDCKTEIAGQESLDYVRNRLMRRFGDVLVAVDRDSKMWFDRVRIISRNWREAHRKFIEEKMRWCDRHCCD